MAKTGKLGGMETFRKENTDLEEMPGDDGNRVQKDILRAFIGTVQHFFGSWQTIFKGVVDARHPDLITYPIASLLCTGVLMFHLSIGVATANQIPIA